MKIDIAHGNGGRETDELIRKFFGRYLGNSILNRMEDAAVLSTPGKIAFTTDSFVVKPLFFPGGDIGKLAVCGTVNDLLMMGARPKYLSMGFILEENLDTDDLEKILASVRAASKEAGVAVVAADTKVIEGDGGMMINTSGIGLVDRPVRISNAGEGDAILLSGELGAHHACIMSARMGIDNDIESDVAPLNAVVGTLRRARIPVHAMRDVTRGGLATVLNEIADANGCRIAISEERIPVGCEVRGFCDILGLDPLYMGNEGKLVAVVPAKKAGAALSAMRRTKYGRKAALIGYAEKGDGAVLETRVGGFRLLRRLRGEGLPRIC